MELFESDYIKFHSTWSENIPENIDSWNTRVHKYRSFHNPEFFVKYLYLSLPDKLFHCHLNIICHIVLEMIGKKNISRCVLQFSKLTRNEQIAYQYIMKQFQNEQKKYNVLRLINNKTITKRLINYFVTHYIVTKNKIGYYLDKSSYPYKIIGAFNNRTQKIDENEKIEWVDLAQSYRNSKKKYSNCHSPYGRSSIAIIDGKKYAICQLNFYLWFDSVNAIGAFEHFESDIKKQKSLFERKNNMQIRRRKCFFENVFETSKRNTSSIYMIDTKRKNFESILFS